jgi:hypothetical protein
MCGPHTRQWHPSRISDWHVGPICQWHLSRVSHWHVGPMCDTLVQIYVGPTRRWHHSRLTFRPHIGSTLSRGLNLVLSRHGSVNWQMAMTAKLLRWPPYHFDASQISTYDHWRGYDPSVLDVCLPGSCQGRSPLEGYIKPTRPSTSTWSRSQKLLVNPNWLHL